MSSCDCGPMRAPGGLGLTEAGMELLNISAGQAVIDIGCGQGETVRFLAEKGISVAGIDSDPAMTGENVVIADAAALPFPDGSFDVAVFECSYSKIARPQAAVNECRRVLKRGGRVLVTDLYAQGESGELGGFLGRVERYADIRRTFEALGLRQSHFEDRSKELISMWSNLVFERGADNLKDEIGAGTGELKRIRCGYFLAVFEKEERSPVDSWVYTLTGSRNTGELEDWQLEKIRSQIHLAKQGRFYAGRLKGIIPESIRSFHDFKRLPFTDADNIAGNENEFLCVRPGEVHRIVTQPSSGTTGLQKRIAFTGSDILRTEEFFVPGLAGLVRGGEQATIYMSNAAPDGIGDLLRRALTRLGAGAVIHGNVTDLKTAAEAGKGSSLFVGFPHEMLALAHLAPELRPNYVLLSADFIPESLSIALERIWGCRVIRHLGLTETCFGCAVDCAPGGGQHIRHADFYLEIVDPETLKPLPDGEFGELVITTLRSEAMPLIRYRTGDITRLLSGVCTCGGTLPRLGHVMGRAGLLKNRLNIYALDELMFTTQGLAGYTARLEGDVLKLSVSGTPPDLAEIERTFGIVAVITGEPPVKPARPGMKRRIEEVNA